MQRIYLIGILVIFSLEISGVGFAQYPISYFTATYLFKVSASNSSWTDTGISIKAGDKMIIWTGGWYTLDTADILEATAWHGPDGHGAYPHSITGPDVNGGALIAKIGLNEKEFYVGTFNAIQAEVAGNFYVKIHDGGTYWDNEGDVVVLIWYFIKDTTTVIEKFSTPTPSNYTLSQNYPNPFNPSSTIEYYIQEAGPVQIKIFNMLGQEVKTLVDRQNQPGKYSAVWDGKDNEGNQLPGGQYFYQIKAGDFVDSKKMLLIK